jgi:hypothetical protein
MPTISTFYGVTILIYHYDIKRHHLPHIHVEYGEFEAVLSINSGEILEGNLPNRQNKLVQAWIEIHRDELLKDWELAVKGKEVFEIEPLK